MAAFDRYGDKAACADAVAAHVKRTSLAVCVQKSRSHRLGISRAELKDMAHLDAFCDAKLAAAARTRVAFAHGGKIRKARFVKIYHASAHVVVIRLICAHDHLARSF